MPKDWGEGHQTKKVRMGSVSRGMGTSQGQEAEVGMARTAGKCRVTVCSLKGWVQSLEAKFDDLTCTVCSLRAGRCQGKFQTEEGQAQTCIY